MSSTLVKHSKRTLRSGCELCGSKDVYRGHDTTVSGPYCPECNVNGADLLLDRDEMPHSLTCPGFTETPKDEPVSVPAVAETPNTQWGVKNDQQVPNFTNAPGNVAGTDAFAAFQALMATLAPKVDRNEVETMIKEQLANVLFPTRTVVERADGSTKTVEGSTHHKVADVITDILAGEHVMMVGPAGTGKSTIAEQSAEALGLAYYSISLSPQTPASAILGYMQAEGKYVRTLYRDAYQHGGVFHFDEIDNSHPSVLAVINASLANGMMAFPDGMVKRHPDFRCVASANTYGKGADRAYVGRQQIDAATLDRFTIETIPVDEALESDICHSIDADANRVADVLRYVRKLRSNAEAHRMHVVISPRASAGMCRLLSAGKSWDAAVEARVRRGMSDQDWEKISG